MYGVVTHAFPSELVAYSTWQAQAVSSIAISLFLQITREIWIDLVVHSLPFVR